MEKYLPAMIPSICSKAASSNFAGSGSESTDVGLLSPSTCVDLPIPRENWVRYSAPIDSLIFISNFASKSGKS